MAQVSHADTIAELKKARAFIEHQEALRLDPDAKHGNSAPKVAVQSLNR